MANLDDVIRNAVPGGNIAKPLMIALLGLLASGGSQFLVSYWNDFPNLGVFDQHY